MYRCCVVRGRIRRIVDRKKDTNKKKKKDDDNMMIWMHEVYSSKEGMMEVKERARERERDLDV